MDDDWRGCFSAFSPINMDEEHKNAARRRMERIHLYNCTANCINNNVLDNIVYRNSSNNYDIRHHVIRWSHTSCDVVFQDGFRARHREFTPEYSRGRSFYYNLDEFVNRSGAPRSQERQSFAFISTTSDTKWKPYPGNYSIYRYEIYAPGGIDVAATLGGVLRYRNQKEICFVERIAPQYIRSAQKYTCEVPQNSRFGPLQKTGRLNFNEDFIFENQNILWRFAL